MQENNENIFNKAAEGLDASDVFANQDDMEFNPNDIFAADESFFKTVENSSKFSFLSKIIATDKTKIPGPMSITQLVLIANMVIITTILVFVLLRPKVIQTVAAPALKTQPEEAAETVRPKPISLTKLPFINKKTAETLDDSVSWQLADQLYQERKYDQSCYVYSRLCENLNTNIPEDELLRDYFTLMMALSLQNTDYKAPLSELFTQVLQSRSPLIRAVANYNLAFIEARNKRYLAARERAYKTIGLMQAFEEHFPPTLEADCYFMLAEALTRQVLTVSESPDALPGERWTNTLSIHSIPQMPRDEFCSLLQSGMNDLAVAALKPQITEQTNMSVGLRWSTICLDAPFEELLSQFASKANLDVSWYNVPQQVRERPSTLYIQNASQQLSAEVAAGSIGLIARFDGENVNIYNPYSYNDLEEYKNLLTREAVSVWRNPADRSRSRMISSFTLSLRSTLYRPSTCRSARI